MKLDITVGGGADASTKGHFDVPPPWVGQVLDHEARMGDETGKKGVY